MKPISVLRAKPAELALAIEKINTQFAKEQDSSDYQEMNVNAFLDAAFLFHSFKEDSIFRNITKRFPDFNMRYREAAKGWKSTFEGSLSQEFRRNLHMWLASGSNRPEITERMEFMKTYQREVLKDSSQNLREDDLKG